MACAINVPTDAVTNGASHEYVREEVIAPREARHTRGRRQSVGANLHKAVVSVFVCDNGR